MKGLITQLILSLSTTLSLALLAASPAAANVSHTFMRSSEYLINEADPTAPLQKLTPNGASIAVECTTFNADGTLDEVGADTLSLIPQYSKCGKVLGVEATIVNAGKTKLNPNFGGLEGGCKYVFGSDTSANSNTLTTEDAPVSIECEAETSLNIIIKGICTIKVGNSANLHGVKYSNVQTAGKPTEVTIEAKIHAVHYTSTGAFCATGGVKAEGDAFYEGKGTVREIAATGDPIAVFLTTP